MRKPRSTLAWSGLRFGSKLLGDGKTRQQNRHDARLSPHQQHQRSIGRADLNLTFLRLIEHLLRLFGRRIQQHLQDRKRRMQAVLDGVRILVRLCQLVRGIELHREMMVSTGGPSTRSTSSRADPTLPGSRGAARTARLRLICSGLY